MDCAIACSYTARSSGLGSWPAPSADEPATAPTVAGEGSKLIRDSEGVAARLPLARERSNPTLENQHTSGLVQTCPWPRFSLDDDQAPSLRVTRRSARRTFDNDCPGD